MTRAAEIIGVGEISLDTLGYGAALPRAGEKAVMHAWRERPGGQTATAVLTAQRLGRRTEFVGVVGDDSAGARALSPLQQAGVALAHVRRRAGATRRAMVWVEGKGERSVFAFAPPAGRLRAADVPQAAVARAALLLTDAAAPQAALRAMRIARAQGRPALLDADTQSPQLNALLALAAVPVLPEALARARFGGAAEAARALAAAGARLAVVTLGAKGALACTADEGARVLYAPAAKAAPLRDTTGAGDAFRGALADALLAGCNPADALARANAVAARNCTGYGAQGALPPPKRKWKP